MPTATTPSSKPKITVTLSPNLVHQLDSIVAISEGWSRSRLVEEALRQWIKEHAQKELERQIEEYYHSLSKAECKEDRQWSKIAARSARRLWDR